AGLGGIPPIASAAGRDGKPMIAAAMPVLADGKIRFVGEAVALVVAETPAQAQDAADQVAVEVEALGCLADIESALTQGAPRCHETAPDNRALDWRDGDTAAVEAAFARAAHVERVRLADTRLAPVSMEPRAGIGAWDPVTGRYTLLATTQGVAVVRKLLAEG